MLINTARGSVVDEMSEALESGQLSGVGTYLKEKSMAAVRAVRCWPVPGRDAITLHIGGATRESIACTETVLIERFLEVLKADGATGSIR